MCRGSDPMLSCTSVHSKLFPFLALQCSLCSSMYLTTAASAFLTSLSFPPLDFFFASPCSMLHSASSVCIVTLCTLRSSLGELLLITASKVCFTRSSVIQYGSLNPRLLLGSRLLPVSILLMVAVRDMDLFWLPLDVLLRESFAGERDAGEFCGNSVLAIPNWSSSSSRSIERCRVPLVFCLGNSPLDETASKGDPSGVAEADHCKVCLLLASIESVGA
mmetsp:Transcript_27337/g.63491  ORF Transcript_27337/g.63491 Transcript_27337/m.63491 type:complete len:219 (-) Transcript_27337:370-1026(-)